MNNFKLVWNLFDGDGGDGASNGISAEASAFASSIGMNVDDLKGESKAPQQSVVYGKSPEGSPVGEDKGEQTPTKTVEEEFAELIGKGGKYAEVYGNNVKQAIESRFKNATNWEGVVSDYEAATAPLLMKYGLEAGDIEGLKNAIEGDDDLYARQAEEEGITTDKYRENIRLRLDAERGRTMQEEYQKEQQRRQMFAQWDAEADELKQAFPNFDLQQEFANENFTKLLDAGIGVKEAFFTTHMQDILSGAENYARQDTKQTVAQNMQRAASRPIENGMSNNPAIVRKADPSTLTDEDMDRIFKEVEAGGTVSF